MKAEEHTELIEILDCHFDPEKTPVKPPTKNRSPKRRTNSRRSSSGGDVRNKEVSKSQSSGDEAHSSPKTNVNNNNSGEEVAVSPDSTVGGVKPKRAYRPSQNKSRQSAGGDRTAAAVPAVTSQGVTV